MGPGSGDALGRIFIVSAALHGVAGLVITNVTPSEYYNFGSINGRVSQNRTPARDEISAEPKLPVEWTFEARLRDDLMVRSTHIIAPEHLAMINEKFQRSHELFASYYGFDARELPALEIRIVPFWMMNDGDYFNVDPGHLYYGRYFTKSNYCYLTPKVWEHENHLVHELGHYLADEYDLGFGDIHGEVRARWFERYVNRFERVVERAHEHDVAPVIRMPVDGWRIHRPLNTNLHLRSSTFMSHEHFEYLAEAHDVGARTFSRMVGQPERPPEPLDVVVLYPGAIDRVLKNEAGSRAPFGHYFPEAGTVVTSRRAFRDEAVIAHHLAHHYMQTHGMSLSHEEAERVAFRFERVLKQVLRGELEPREVRPLAMPPQT